MKQRVLPGGGRGRRGGNVAFGSPNKPLTMDWLGQAHLAQGRLRCAF